MEEKCHKPCKKEWSAYEKCQERIKAKGHGSCEPWTFDYWKCIDKCVSGCAPRRAFACAGRIGPPFAGHRFTRTRARARQCGNAGGAQDLRKPQVDWPQPAAMQRGWR
jgi:hypothetical protein